MVEDVVAGLDRLSGLASVSRLNGWQVRDRLAVRLFEPFRLGSAYGTVRVESADGSRTFLYGLSSRSKNHTNGDEALSALNAAHRDAVCRTAAAGRVSAVALVRAAVAELLDERSEGVLPEDFVEVFSVLLLDELEVSPALVPQVGRWPFGRWSSLTSERIAELVASAVALSGVSA